MSHNPTIDVAAIVQDEEEIIPLMLRSCETLLPNLQKVVIVDGGSVDRTIDIINSWRDRLPIDLVGHPFDNFCYQRNRALSRCSSDFVLSKTDADLTWGNNLRDELPRLWNTGATFFDFLCYFNVIDAYHCWDSPSRVGYATVLCKNVGARFVRPIHEYLVLPGEERPGDILAMVRHDWSSVRRGSRLMNVNEVPFFDNSLRKSDSALQNRARRYARWSDLSGQAGIPFPSNDDNWCVRNKDELMSRRGFREHTPEVKRLIIEGT